MAYIFVYTCICVGLLLTCHTWCVARRSKLGANVLPPPFRCSTQVTSLQAPRELWWWHRRTSIPVHEIVVQMYAYMYVCMPIYMCVYITHRQNTDTQRNTIYIYIYIHTYIHIYIYIYIHTYMHACIHTYTYMHACTYARTYVRITSLSLLVPSAAYMAYLASTSERR
jgi:hypothetical protein